MHGGDLAHDERIAYFSPYSQGLTGYTAAEVTGRAFVPLFVPESARADVSRAIDATLAGRPTSAYEIPILHRDGRRRWFVWNAQRLDDFDGSPAVLAVGQDFTEQREAQERLLRSERLAGIGQMITGIAHESRNALQRIQSCTEMLELEIEHNQEAQRLVRRSQEAQDNLLRLFDEVRGYAAPIQLETALCRIDAIWREAWELLETRGAGANATFSESAECVDPIVAVDRFRMVQVFRNLLGKFLGGVRRSGRHPDRVPRRTVAGAAGDRSACARQWPRSYAGGTAKHFRAVLHDEDEGHRAWHGDCKTDRRCPRRANCDWQRPDFRGRGVRHHAAENFRMTRALRIAVADDEPDVRDYFRVMLPRLGHKWWPLPPTGASWSRCAASTSPT